MRFVTIIGLLIVALIGGATSTSAVNDVWEKSQPFTENVTREDGTTSLAQFVGEKGEFGMELSAGDVELVNATPTMKAHEIVTVDWNTWSASVGTDVDKVVGLSQETGEKVTLLMDDNLDGSSRMVLPEQGLWKLFIYINGEKAGDIVVNATE
ncbi:hypothetical protein N781_04330 [Pontibacillus halophilus JSM 076056 = DSM 19796]|uniref:DUF4871 domain-containing protein n=1 Tax=Pontibacillus halophilus JSM 076056 = DSM 19796 TaxID=1385510 RepID=A0A0A5GDV9_9BACI|nr:hypothetical protein [Pontibacillus halophilus]KGX91396.1 hypothetical protein N781_04330 [Pontibacillus halophilus JSM 076056 = DSM 19796]